MERTGLDVLQADADATSGAATASCGDVVGAALLIAFSIARTDRIGMRIEGCISLWSELCWTFSRVMPSLATSV